MVCYQKVVFYFDWRGNKAHYAKSLDVTWIIAQRKQISGSYQIAGCILHPMTTPAPLLIQNRDWLPLFHTNGLHTIILQITLKKTGPAVDDDNTQANKQINAKIESSWWTHFINQPQLFWKFLSFLFDFGVGWDYIHLEFGLRLLSI